VSTSRAGERLGGAFAFAGTAVLLAATLLHPATADPADPVAAFAEYAASDIWVTAHLAQFVGFALLGAALVALGGTLGEGYPAALGRIAAGGAVAMIALAAVLQAVDGVALKVAVDRWVVAIGDARTRAFEAAFAVRQIEVGLAALLQIVSGMTLFTLSAAVLGARRHPRWFGVLGLAGALGALVAGYAYATAGFDGGAMTASMVSSLLLLAWALAASTLMLTASEP
jgi:hypothetical protein